MKKYSYGRSRMETKVNNASKRVNNASKKVKKLGWKYHNLIFLAASIIIAYYILAFKPVLSFIQGLSYLGYAAGFIFGMLFSYALTAAPATAVLYNLGRQYNPLLIAFIGAFGSVVSDYLIFRFVRDKLMDEIKLLSEEVSGLVGPLSNLVFKKRIQVIIWRKISRSRTWKLLIPVIAGFIIASPLPDELGAAIFGAAKYEPRKFLMLSYCLNFIGILVIASLAKIL